MLIDKQLKSIANQKAENYLFQNFIELEAKTNFSRAHIFQKSSIGAIQFTSWFWLKALWFCSKLIPNLCCLQKRLNAFPRHRVLDNDKYSRDRSFFSRTNARSEAAAKFLQVVMRWSDWQIGWIQCAGRDKCSPIYLHVRQEQPRHVLQGVGVREHWMRCNSPLFCAAKKNTDSLPSKSANGFSGKYCLIFFQGAT